MAGPQQPDIRGSLTKWTSREGGEQPARLLLNLQLDGPLNAARPPKPRLAEMHWASASRAATQPWQLTDGPGRRDGAGSQRPAARPLHLPVQLPVPQVVHRAARAAQQHRAGAEQGEQAQVGEGARRRRQGDGPEAGPGQQPGADWLLQPHQLRVRHPAGWQAVQPGASGCRCARWRRRRRSCAWVRTIAAACCAATAACCAACRPSSISCFILLTERW